MFTTATANRMTPQVTAAPPTPLPGLSACHRLITLGVGAAVLFVLAVLATSLLNDAPSMRIVVPVVFLGGGGLLAVVALRLQTRLLAELQHGYTTLRIQFGRARGDRWRQQSVGGGRLAWDYRGTWFLRSDGTVRTPPVPDVDPPGFYPSPTEAGRFELWTGRSWAGRFLR
ncbi:hypothetical protein E9228_002238 [Curtobacterium flaccumfaciens]|uniref:Uncharacterized protein n=1 Tax=Curtobacterium salicis TaxID=1779862 RepID=A0ABX0T7X2_9MICO|nr:hypothetical protein [Curtobacterium sp. WW7]